MQFKYKLLSIFIFPIFMIVSQPSFAELFFYMPDEFGECTSSYDGVHITDIQEFYRVGDKINIGVRSFADTNTFKQVDLWIIIKSKEGGLLYLGNSMLNRFSPSPQPFRESVQYVNDTFSILENFEVPNGIGGDYSVYAFFSKEGQSTDSLFETLMSNVAIRHFTISNN